MPRFSLIFSLLFLTISLFAQKTPNIHVVSLIDKNNSAYTIYQPWEFLSPRALERRKNAGIAITESDLPVNETYLEQIRKTGARVKARSKWMNSALVVATETQLKTIQQFPFVKETIPVGIDRVSKPQRTPIPIPKEQYASQKNRYGTANHQIKMLQGHVIHLLGSQGEGKLVAVLDGGFINADVLPFFDSLRVKGDLLPSKDFVYVDDYAYEDTGHGTQALSTMAANLPGLMVGTAPHASYVCIKTEEIGAENPVEEEYWIAGLEYADSIGADVVNSSLGYTTFDMKEYNHLLEKLDGQTYRASIAASIGAKKGILIFNSAGNEGNGRWSKIGVPADAFDIISVGAVDTNKNKARFSSFGPTADGRIKPDLSTMGKKATVSSLKSYKTATSSGTSFSSPILAGMSTSLWSAFPKKSWNEVKDALILSGSRASLPDTLLGYGIPDFTKAYANLSGIPTHFHRFDKGTRIFKKDDYAYQIIYKKGTNTSDFVIRNYLGQIIQIGSQSHHNELGILNIKLEDETPSGVYQVMIQSGKYRYWVHLIL